MVDQGMRMPAEAAALILMDGTTSDFSEIAERTSRIMPTLVYANTDALPAAEAGSPRGCRRPSWPKLRPTWASSSTRSPSTLDLTRS